MNQVSQDTEDFTVESQLESLFDSAEDLNETDKNDYK